MYAGLTTWMKHYDTKHPHFTLTYDDGDTVPDGFFTIAANTNPYTFVGNRPFDVAPDADLTNGLTVVTVRSMRVDRLLRVMQKALKGDGSLASDPNVHQRVDVDHVIVEAIDGEPFPYQVDGDYLGEIEKLEFRHVPDAMDLLLPVDFAG